jgi:hypothetical protein
MSGQISRSLSHITPTARFSTDALKSAQMPVTAIDLRGRMGHEQAQNLPSLEPGADAAAATLAQGSLEVMQSSVPELVLASPALPVNL